MSKTLSGPKEIIDAGFDYLTISIPHTHPNLDQFREIGVHQFERLERANFKTRDWTFHEVNGLTNGTFSYGSMPKFDILRVSGHEARNVAEEIKQYGLRARITRADLQVTTVDGCGDERFARKIGRKVQRGEERRGLKRKTPISTFSGTTRDTGLTLGSRDSNTYFRIYDAHAQHKTRYPFDSRRVEGEFKDAKACSVWDSFVDGQSQEELAKSVCAGRLQGLGVMEPWMLRVVPHIPKGETISSTDEKRLWWLEHQVAPVIKKLMQTPHAGKLRLIMLDALGIPSRELDLSTRLEENTLQE